MVTTGQIVGIAMAFVLPILVGAIPFALLRKRSSKIEGGMPGAIGYGVMGYVWQELIYSFLGLLTLTKLIDVLNMTGAGAILIAIVESLLSAIFVSLGMYWALYLTNTKQRSIYRSATIGIGFGIGYALLTYGFQLYYAIKINSGTFTGVESAKAAILATSTASLYVAAYRNIVMLLVFLGVALFMGKYYLAGKRLFAWVTPIIVYAFIRFVDVILNTYLPDAVAEIIVLVMLTALAAGSVWVLIGFLRTGVIAVGKMRDTENL